jgi:fatty acid CoA ligase FadD9
MPLNHGAGRGAIFRSILRGGTTYFVAKSDMSTLFDDMRLARPTTMLLVPRVAGAIHQRFQTELVRRSSDEPSSDERERERVEKELVGEMRESLVGNRLLLLMTSTAPTPPEIVSFLERCFQIPVVDLYGSTEAGPLTFDHRVNPEVGIVWKLVDVPELGYRASDEPYPRGELHVKSPFVIPGYFDEARATQDLFDDEGFLNTGDIVEQHGADTLLWIDRAKNILKLAQGEFVAISRLEGIYAARSPFIRQVYLHGDSFHAYLLAVIVPNLEAIGTKDDAAIKSLLRAELDRVAREETLRSHEVPRDFLVEREPFTVENGLLTASNKPSRPRLAARYRKELDAMNAAIERAQVEELYALRGPVAGASVASVGEKVLKAMSVTLGLTDRNALQDDRSFIHLGGDSLSAVDLETLIHDITGVHVPVGFLLDPTSSVRAIVAYVERELAGRGGRKITFESVHGASPTSLRASDVRIETFFRAEELEAARAAPSELPARSRVALLTGANGFLGRFLVLELLERLLGRGKKLYALVRATNDAAAFERLASSYRSDPRLWERFRALSANLHVLAGDLIEPSLGLADDVYAELADEVDLILHNGALVNHALAYERLFEPNVLGTVHVMRLALARRKKSISYVSTIGVLRPIERPGAIREDEDLRALVPERLVASGYAAGYGVSKWASELLLRAAHDTLGLPVTVFRPSEIMAHPEYLGQVNVPDFFTRLLAGIVYTGLAPKTFYASSAPAHVRHFDGLPVEIVARSIVAPSVIREAPAHYRTYNVVNPHEADGVSLDVVVDWMRTAGYPIERVLDYDEWYRRFHDRLASLPEPQRQHSPLAILDAWSRREGARTQPAIDGSLLLARLRAMDASLAEIPHISEPLIHTTLEDMALLGVIDRPPRSPAHAA